MTKARRDIDVGVLGIANAKLHKDVSRDIPGKESEVKAKTLAGRLEEVIGIEKGVRVLCPLKKLEIRCREVDKTISSIKIVVAIAESGGCKLQNVKVGVMHPPIRGTRNM